MNTESAASQGRVPDAQQRAEALDPQRSFIVKAPAGSGKTSLLVARFLTLLAGARRPEEVLAITFTRKATAEMRARVLDALNAASAAAPQASHERQMHALAVAVAQRDAELGWQLGDNPQRLRIQTIDALCGSLARQLPVMSGLGGGLRTLDDASPLFAATARRTLALIADRDLGAEVGGAVARVLEHVDGNMAAFENLVAQMLARREQWIRYLALDDRAARAALESAISGTVDVAIKAANRAMPTQQRASLLALAQFAAQRAQALRIESALLPMADVVAFPRAHCDDLAQWKVIAHLLLTRDGGLRKRVMTKIFVKKDTPDEYVAMQALLGELADDEQLAPALNALRALPAPTYDEQQWRTLQDLFAVLKLAMAMLRIEFASANACDFTEQVLAASQALGEEQAPSDLTLALEHRIAHLLVDEFQDTSVAHFEIINKLIAGWSPGDGHTLFVVGDPMQSIYRFREAEVGLFLACYAQGMPGDAGDGGARGAVDDFHGRALQGIDLQPLALRTNFRSREGVVAWVNRHFVNILPARDDAVLAAASFESSQAVREAGESPAVELHAVRGESVEQQARRVAQCVANTRASSAQHSIAILLRARTHAHAVVDALVAQGLTWRGLDLQPLFGVPAVRDLHALTCAVLHPLDRASWLAVLRAPWCGMTLDDLEALLGDAPTKAVVQLLDDAIACRRLSADGRQRLARVAPVLRELMMRRGEDRLAALIRRAWRALGGPACLDGASIDDPRRYLELLAATERDDGRLDADELERRVAQLYASPRADAVDVEIMTIHRAKGLEFDVVLLPSLERSPRGDSLSMLAWSRVSAAHGGGLLLAPLPPPEGEEHSPIHRFVRGVEADKRRLETARLLYVACTRARERMHLFASVRWNDKKDEVAMPGSDSLLAWLWPAVGPQCAALPAPPDDDEQAQPLSPQPTIARLPSDYALGDLPPALAGVGADDASGADPQAVEFSWAGRSARLVGIVAHNALRQISEQGLALWDAPRVARNGAQWNAQLRELGLEGDALDEATQAVSESVARTLGDARGQWLLDGAHRDARSEYPVSGLVDDAVVNAVIDRTFVDEQGVRWIVDYKTGVHRGGAIDEFLHREQLRYAPQLQRYAVLMQALDPRPIRLALYFPAIGAWREWAWGDVTC